MLFVQSLRGLSHTKLEDTKPEHLELSVQALDRLAAKALAATRGLTEPERRFSGCSQVRRGSLTRTQTPDASSSSTPTGVAVPPPRLPPVNEPPAAAGAVGAALSRRLRRSCARPAGSAVYALAGDAELRRHDPPRPALAAARRADAARRAERLRLRLDVRLARPLAGAVPAADARGDEHRAAAPRPERHEPRHARADRDRERVRDAPGRLRTAG